MDPHIDKTPADAAEPAMAQVLFMDVVEYGKLNMREQLGVSYQLTDLVRNTSQYRSGEGKDTILCRPTGDGMAVVFFADFAAPIRCAMEINANVKKQALIRLRMGIHSGPIYRTTDINKQADVAGDAIIMAQRVMDAGDADHILLSRAMAEILLPLGEWNDYIAEVGPVEIKHGGQIFLYNFSGSDFGNPGRPSKRLQRVKRPLTQKKLDQLQLEAQSKPKRSKTHTNTHLKRLMHRARVLGTVGSAACS